MDSLITWSPTACYIHEELKNEPTFNFKSWFADRDIMLRSINELQNYVLEATDGDIGRCKDFLFDDVKWNIRYMVAEPRTWLPGRKVLVSPHWINNVSWSERKVFFELSKEKIENGPQYNPAEPPNRKYEDVLYNYYGFPPYW